MKKTICLLLAALMLFACACGKQETGAEARQKANEICVGIAQDLSSSLSPYQLSTAGTREVMFNVFEGLYKSSTSSRRWQPAARSRTTA